MVKCIKIIDGEKKECGREVCQGKAIFYKFPLSSMCQHHRNEEIKRMEKEKC